MKKSCILLMTLILCLCAGCSSQPAPDASQTRPETNLFETQVNSVNRAFVAETDLFRYVAALNQGLAEIDKESGEIVWYPERDSMFDLAVLNDGRIVYEVLDYQANTGIAMIQVVADDLYGNTEVLFEFEDGFIMNQSVVGEYLYSYTNNLDLVRTNLSNGKSETILTTESLAQYMLVDESGVWYSDEYGLYFWNWDADNVQFVIDEPVGYIQKIDNTICFLIHGKNGIYAYDIESAEYNLVYDLDVSLFVITEDKKTLYAVEQTGKSLFRFDIVTGQRNSFVIPCEYVTDFNIINGQVYVLGYSRAASYDEFDKYFTMRIEDDQVYQIIE